METKSPEGLRDEVGSDFHAVMSVKWISGSDKPLEVSPRPAFGDGFDDLTEPGIDALHLRGALRSDGFMPIAVT